MSYYPNKVDFKFNPLAKPKLENPSALLLEKIYPMPKTPDAETEQICFIDINIAGGDPMRTNTGFRRVELIFDVICHLDSWIIKGGFRPLKILGYIDGLLNKSRLTGIGTLLFSGAGQILTSSDYSGYSLTFNAIHGSDDLIPPEG